jgi:phosphotransferase system  glucose/maltose/N-acetylglucosamine-specific IIC component
VLTLLFDDRRLLAATVLVPTAIAFAALLALVLVRMVWGVAMKGVMELGRTAVTPTIDHRAVRVRTHRSKVDHG